MVFKFSLFVINQTKTKLELLKYCLVIAKPTESDLANKVALRLM